RAYPKSGDQSRGAHTPRAARWMGVPRGRERSWSRKGHRSDQVRSQPPTQLARQRRLGTERVGLHLRRVQAEVRPSIETALCEPMTDAVSSLLEAALRRDRTVVVIALIAVIFLSWLWVALGAGMEMSAVEMTRMPRDMVMVRAVWEPAYAAMMFAMWWVMMIAMMLPSATPILLIFARINRRD